MKENFPQEAKEIMQERVYRSGIIFFANKKDEKERHDLQISGRMKSRHTIRKETANHVQEDCTAERRSYQGAN